MKIAVRIINIVLCIVVILLCLTILSKKEYAETVCITPLFLDDLIYYIILFVVTPTVISIGVVASINKHYRPSLILLIFSLGSFYMAYQNYPSVRRDAIYPNIVKVDIAIDELTSSKAKFLQENALDYYGHYMSELLMFKKMYTDQYNYLGNSITLKYPRANRLTILFGVIGFMLFLNSGYQYIKRKAEALENTDYID